MGCRELKIQDYFRFSDNEKSLKNEFSFAQESNFSRPQIKIKKVAYSRFSHNLFFPIGEKGGINIYGIVSNNSINYIDLLGLIVGPSDIYVAVKSNFPTSVFSSDSLENGCWSVSGNLEIVGSSTSSVASIKPTGHSSSINDSTVSFISQDGVRTESKNVTIRRPKWLSSSTPVPFATGARATIGFEVDSSLTYFIKDQFSGAWQAGWTVNEDIQVWNSPGVKESPIGTASGVTGAGGSLTDSRTTLFTTGASGQSQIFQTITIGEYQAVSQEILTVDSSTAPPTITWAGNVNTYPAGFY